MKNKVISCMYHFVQDVQDSPLSVELIVNSSDCSEEEVRRVFEEFKSSGLLNRKHMFSHVYTLTDEGFQTVKKGWEDYNRFNAHDRPSDASQSIAS